jgi:hypothetical protein
LFKSESSRFPPSRCFNIQLEDVPEIRVSDGLETEALRLVELEMAKRPPTVFIPLSVATEFIDSATAAFALGRLTNNLEVWPTICHFALAQLCAGCEACITRSTLLAHKCGGQVDAYLTGRFTLICRLFRTPAAMGNDSQSYSNLRTYLYENTHHGGNTSAGLPPRRPAPLLPLPYN